ncbi:MAG: DNA repair protein RadA [Calditrichaeota bacterium]|nr:MAG: DNA repair protein RadA [Calditrichota bacterium]
MAKPKHVYICQQCGYQSPKWLGRCPDCEGWNTFIEEEISPQTPKAGSAPKTNPIPLSQISDINLENRISTGIDELDRTLGGGLLPASVILLAGEPGIGKSTLLLQMAEHLLHKKQKVLYISGEESPQQIKNRATRLKAAKSELLILTTTDLSDILYHITNLKPDVVIVDSIQAVYNPEFSGAPGNVGQVRECAARLFQLAKEQSFALWLIGHVTKEGAVAGPKILEHLVDVVIYFEENTRQHRIIRAVKNRFGAANELGVFEMRHNGLHEVKNVSELFLTPDQSLRSGSSIVCTYEGSRPLLVEVQALVNRSNYGTPQRTVSGFDYRRLSLLLAILEKYCHLNFGLFDVFVKVAGGLRIDDPGIDLGVAAALYSSRLDQPTAPDTVYIGELGLGGEVRPVSFIEKRLQESMKMGFKQVYLPAGNLPDSQSRKKYKLLLSPVEKVNDLLLPRE